MIRGSAEIMNENPTDEYKTSKFCTVIINSVDRLIKVMTPMMKYGRPISTLTSTPFQIAPLLEEIRQLSEGSCRKKNLKISVDCPDSLTVFADRESVAQILINLVVNAQQYTPEGGQICITATEATYTDTQSQHQIGVCIAVRDTGQGISKDNLTKIFDPFFSSKTDTNNIGLGLSIVFRYVTENNGKIELDSEVGVGTTFRIYLPIAMLENPVETESISGVYFSDSLF
jgi:signal transduction histidine kinase